MYLGISVGWILICCMWKNWYDEWKVVKMQLPVQRLTLWLTWALQRQHTWLWGCPRIRAGSCRDGLHPGRTPTLTWRSKNTTPPCRTRRVSRCSRQCGSPSRSQHSPKLTDITGLHPEVSREPYGWGRDHCGNPWLSRKCTVKYSRQNFFRATELAQFRMMRSLLWSQVIWLNPSTSWNLWGKEAKIKSHSHRSETLV